MLLLRTIYEIVIQLSENYNNQRDGIIGNNGRICLTMFKIRLFCPPNFLMSIIM